MMRHKHIIMAVGVIGALTLAAVESAPAKTRRCPITGKRYSVGGRSCGRRGGSGGARFVRSDTKVSLVRVVDHEGDVDYFTAKSEKTIESRRRKVMAAYEKVKSRRDRMAARSGAGEALWQNERPAPVAPQVDVLASGVLKCEAGKQRKAQQEKDWAVYEIAIGDAVSYEVCFSGTDAFANAQAQAMVAKLRNKSMRQGSSEAEPAPTVQKVTSDLDKRSAEKQAVAMKTKRRSEQAL